VPKIVVVLAIASLLLESQEIISEFEYGQMLYNNPRGVSCMPCHGVRGSSIVSYDSKGKKITLVAPNIVDKSIKEYKKATQKGAKIMPKYFLTDKELSAIYRYIQIANKRVKRRDKNEKDSIDITIDDIVNFGQDTDTNQTAPSSSLKKLEQP
jgi:cytochrome c553